MRLLHGLAAAEHVLGAARMTDMLAKIRDMTGYDPTECATLWLRTLEVPSTNVCP